MTRSPYDDHSYDVNQAIRRSSAAYTTDTSATDSEGAFLDRATLAREVVRLRRYVMGLEDELAATRATLGEAEVEVDHLVEQMYLEQPAKEQP